MEEYIEEVKAQLYCNATKEYSSEHITYTYTNKQIYDNLDYFERCEKAELSAYKALLFFWDYLEDRKGL